MCFHIDSKHPEKQIAEYDIIVHKGLDAVYYQTAPMIIAYVTPWKNYLIKFGTLLTAKIKKQNGGEIHEGLHSISPNQGKYWWSSHTFKAIIPKGSEYYYSSNGDYVSNQLIITIEEIE